MAKKHVNNQRRKTQGSCDNRANQLNPNNNAYWKARGHDKRSSYRNNAPSAKK